MVKQLGCLYEVVNPVLIVSRIFLVPENGGNSTFPAGVQNAKKFGAVLLCKTLACIDLAFPWAAVRVDAGPG